MEHVQIAAQLPAPARYYPLEKGVYEVAPGLRTLGTPFGNGELDGKVFQLDREFAHYRKNKLECRAERLGKYFATHDLKPEVETAATRFLLRQLLKEYPALFEFQPSPKTPEAGTLQCRLTGEKLELDFELRLVGMESTGSLPNPPYVSALDALCSQIQEDIAVLSTAEGRDWLSALHLCSPSHWAAEDKIGKDFIQVHLPVAGIDKINRAAQSFVDAMIRKGPYVRFVWGFGTDRQLNHHPTPPPGITHDVWRGRSFNRANTSSPFTLRVERQVTFGLPEVNAAMFMIRVYFIDGSLIKADPRERELLRTTLLSMNAESLAYKGLTASLPEILAWLDSPISE